MDFTLRVLSDLLGTLRDSGYNFMTVNDFSSGKVSKEGKQLVLRHDVDKKPINSLVVATIESELGIKGTYYFRITPGSLDKDILREISSMGHEVGYHYEDLDLVSQKSKAEIRKSKVNGEYDLVRRAFDSFRANLADMRQIVPVETVCMHGSPMSRHDSRIMWKYFNYGDLEVKAEPYFDIPLEEMLYLTDTGRRWDGSAVSVRDRLYNRNESYYNGWVRRPVVGSAMVMTERGEAFQRQFRFRNTRDLLSALKMQCLPERIFLTLHPQRWSNTISAWAFELLAQNAKNQVKYLIKRRGLGSRD